MQLTADNLAGERGGVRIFENVSFALSAGEGMLVTGPNGAGKSTFLCVIAGLLHAAEGSVAFGSKEVAPRCHFLGPENAMKPSLSVAENLDFWRAYYGGKRSIMVSLEHVQLPHIHDVPFSDLSTGQKRRVAIARLLVAHRPIWLLDEPTSGLDSDAEMMFAGLVGQHMADGGIVVVASHVPIDVPGAKMKRLRFEGRA